MKFIQTHFNLFSFLLSWVFGKMLFVTFYWYGSYRANEGYGILLTRFITDHKDIIFGYKL